MKKRLGFSLLIAAFSLAIYVSFLAPSKVAADSNLVEDPGFETSMSNFEPNQDGTSVSLTSISPINGSRSLVVGTTGYGDSVLWQGRDISTFATKRSNQFTASVRIRSTVGSASEISFCGLVDYATGEGVRNCKEVTGSVGDKGTVNLSFALDNSRDLDRVRVGIFQEGSAALREVLIDDLSVILTGISIGSPAPTPVNGACGSSNNATVASAPTTNLCSSGSASTVAGSGPWTWSCAGSNGGTTASCSAQMISTSNPVNGTCGAANNTQVSSAPTNYLCSSGTASTVSGSGPWTWSCSGTNGGTNSSCSAQTITTQNPVNGVCGSANNTTVSTAPTTGLCSVGSASTVAGSGPWTWSCAGQNGGTTGSCSAQKTISSTPPPVSSANNLIEEPSFETTLSNFEPNQAGTSVNVTNVNPISGARSLSITTGGYGDSILWAGRDISTFTTKRSSQFTGSIRIRSTVASASEISFCGLVDYATGSGVRNCTNVSGSVGDKGTVNLSFALDSARDLDRVRVGIFQEGSSPLRAVMLDDASVVLAGISPPIPVSGACGSSNNTTLSSAPTTNLCASGSPSSVSGSGPWSWTCNGSNGGTTASCTAQRTITQTPVNGVCGSANNTTVSTAPTTNLCSSGSASTVAGSGPWTWSCAGSNGGTTGNCSAQLSGSTTIPPSTRFTIGQRVQTTANLNVRATPNTAGTLLGTQTSGSLGTVTGGPVAQGGYNWWGINYDAGADGYSVENFLTAYSSPNPPPTPPPGGAITYPAFNLNDPADAPLIKFAETWARNWNFEGHNVDPNFSGNSGNWNYTETTYEPWLFDRASVGYYLYKRTTDPTQKARWYQQFLSDFAYYRNHIDSAGIFTPKGYGDTKYSYITPFLLYEKETGDTQYRPIAQRIYNAWMSDFSSTYSPNGNDLWTEREIGLALEAAVSWYEITGDSSALTRANALISQWTVVANAGGGVPLTTVDRHEGGGGTQLITSPWMSGLYFQAARRLYAITGNTEILQQVTRYADWMEQHAYFDAGVVDDPYAGITAAYYLVGPTGPYTPETPSAGDLDHCLDVSGIVSFAISAKQLLGQSATALTARHAQLRTCAVYAFNDATRTTITLPKYRVNPPRKFNWWMRSTLGYNGPTSPVTPPPTTLVNGVCGSANNTTVASAPTTNLCSAGTASAVAGSGPWTWSCAGSNGGTTANCSAQRTASTPPTSYSLSVSLGGSGTVVSTPTGINCGAACTANFTSGTSVTLTATPATGNTFIGWSGGVCSGTGTCVVSMTAVRSVGATFAANTTQTSVRPLATANPRVLLNDATTVSRLQNALSTNAAGAARFRTMVNNELASPGTNYAFQGWFAALMYRLTGTASYGTFAVNKVDTFVNAEMARINAGQRPLVAGDSFLEVGDMVGDVALVYDWANNLLTPAQKTTWVNYMNLVLNNLWGNPDAVRWGGVSYPWSGWSLNDPYNNYYYSFLQATMLTGLATYGDNPQAQQWLNKFYNDKIIAQLLPAFNIMPGGGSREGTGYGTALARLFKLYFWWEKSTGVNIANQTPHTLGTMFWFTHSIVPSLDKLVPTGDHSRDETAELYDYHRDLLQNLISLYPNEQISGAVKQLLSQSNVQRMQFSVSYWSDFVNDWPSITARPLTTLNTTYFGTGTGNFYTRSSWNNNAIMVHMMAGPYDQSHAHRDQGSVLLNSAGAWLFDDANRRSSSGIELDEEMHNLVRFRSGGSTVRQVESAAPSEVLALSDGTLFSYELANTKPIYNNKPEVVKSEREMVFIKQGAVVLFDRSAANSSAVSRIFQLQMSTAPFISGNRLTFTSGAQRADVWRLSPANVPWTTVPVFSGQRAEAVDNNGTQSLFLHVIGVNSQVTSVISDNTATETGARITFSDGTVATVRFSNAGRGGTLNMVSASGQTLYNAALPITVNTFPQYQQ
ncbi:MAG: hypothetical protein HYT15_00555 [Candidatus Magasanikbacteria bacterium]|nr:hypothetical protein [Candidatus Magasanikbacteria bacterium]